MVYVGLFFLALATLAFEVTLVRLLSVVAWYHLAFFAISTAMLGMTAGATKVYLQRRVFDTADRGRAVSLACLRFSVSIPGVLILLCVLPLGLYESVLSPLILLIATAACALPFYFSGIVITASLTKFELPIGKLYAADLIGASLGCFLVLGGLRLLDAPSLILVCGGFGVLAGACYARHAGLSRLTRTQLALVPLFLLVGFLNAQTPYGIRPLYVKGRIEKLDSLLLEKWNSFSRVVVYEPVEAEPMYWGPSPVAPTEPVLPRYAMNIDGDAGTNIRRFHSAEDIEHLGYDVTNVGYHLGRKGRACVLGLGGGRDIQAAILYGLTPVDGVDINPTFIELLEGEMREFAAIGGRDDVNLIVDDGRSFLTQSEHRYAIIQMSLIDTWAATGAGAFTLSEHSLYTLEAWDVFINRLAPDGIFMVSRWHSPSNLGETGRILSLAVASLLRQGVEDPGRHLALITSDQVSTLLLGRSPLAEEDIAKLEQVCADLQFNAVHLPGRPPVDERLSSILAAGSDVELERAIASATLNYEPPTDNNPYFFNMLRLRNLFAAFGSDVGMQRGNLLATLTLLGLLMALTVLALVTIVIPLLLGTRRERSAEIPGRYFWSGAVYFALIGSAFMLLEIALIQRLTVFLGHPIYALGILLSSLIASTGVGSFISDRLPLTRPPWSFVYPGVTAGLILCLPLVFDVVLQAQSAAPIGQKILIAVAIVSPLGILLGFFFPAGMRMVGTICPTETPWYWALNGIFGVLCSAVAVLISIYSGITTNVIASAVLYASVLFVVPVFRPKAVEATRRDSGALG